MSNGRLIISGRESLLAAYHNLHKGDIVRGRIPLHVGEEHLLLDLTVRGIHLIPSAMAQLASRSKAFQAEILTAWMLPLTTVIYTRQQLLEATGRFHQHNVGRVVLKQNRKNAGIGILLYNSIEEIYSLAGHHSIGYPFVLQPYVEKFTDLRVIILDDYVEAYHRCNPHGFRKNLHCGGKAAPHFLRPETVQWCREVMQRVNFPYAHLDLMIDGGGAVYLAEINLRGGIRGAQIGKQQYADKIGAIEQVLLDGYLAQ